MYSPKEYVKHSILFILTLITATLAGGEWVYGKSLVAQGESALTWEYFFKSMNFSIPFIGILLIHELGHLFTSFYHKVKCSLPLFIPVWLTFLGIPSIGTFGAIIRMKSFINSRKKFFDIGVAGPLAGFVIAFGVLIYGFTHLPAADYIYTIHPEYQDPNFQGHGDDVVEFELGKNLFFSLMKSQLADPALMPSMQEIIHYPYLFAGYLALFFTALNLLPIGQLDGGHVIFGLFPRRHYQISLLAFIAFLGYAGLGTISPSMPLEDLMIGIPLYVGFLYICFTKTDLSQKNKLTIALSIAAIQYLIAFAKPEWDGYQGWLLFAFFIGRLTGIKHPEVSGAKPLDKKRQLIGWLAVLIFILCFSPKPFIFS